MATNRKPTREMPGSQSEKTKDDGLVNDSLGTVDPADSTGTAEEKETGEAKKGYAKSREN